MSSFSYHAFGLRIEADAVVPGFPPAPAGPAQLRLHMGSIPGTFSVVPPRWREIWRSTAEADDPSDVVTLETSHDGAYLMLRYADETQFVLRRTGDEIWAEWPRALSPDVAATYLLGPVLGFALRLRGTVCLHASVVVVGGVAIALTGAAGVGKSTTAAAFALRGHRVIADDVAVVDHSDGGWIVHPSVPGVRLWEDSVEMLFGRRDALPYLAAGWEKRVLDLRNSEAGYRAEEPVPLGAVYILSDPETAGAPTRLTSRDALMALVSNTYANVLLDASMRRTEFTALSALVRQIPVWRLAAPESAAALDEFCAAVDAAGATAEFRQDDT